MFTVQSNNRLKDLKGSKDEYNDKVYQSFDSANKYTIKAKDSIIGACSTELKEKIMRQLLYVPLKNSKQLAHKLI